MHTLESLLSVAVVPLLLCTGTGGPHVSVICRLQRQQQHIWVWSLPTKETQNPKSETERKSFLAIAITLSGEGECMSCLGICYFWEYPSLYLDLYDDHALPVTAAQSLLCKAARKRKEVSGGGMIAHIHRNQSACTQYVATSPLPRDIDIIL